MTVDPRLERARALYRETEEKKNGTRNFGGDNASFPFWTMPDGATTVVRFLPDKVDNPWWWAERQTLKLPFEGTVGGDSPTTNRIEVTVPCVDMFENGTCPVIAETKPWWKDDSKKVIRGIYYKKRSFIAQGFVVSSPIEEPTVPENPIRRFMLGKQIVEKLMSDTADAEREFYPTDYLNGYDFRIKKTKAPDGKQNAYGTSGLSIRSRPLSEAEMLAIEQFDLFNLSEFRGPRPDAVGIAVIKAMFHASLAGEPYDFASFGKYFRPYGTGTTDSAAPSLDDTADDAPTVSAVVEPKVVEETSKVSGKQPADILAKLRERTAKAS
jgi:hypothetical protein